MRNESSDIYWSYFFSFCSFNYYLSKFLNYYDEIYKKDDKSTHLNVYDLSKGCDKDLNIIRPFVTLFLAYTSQKAVFPKQLKKEQKKNR